MCSLHALIANRCFLIRFENVQLTWCMVLRFCPSVFFYLMCLVPTIWLLELNDLEQRIANEGKTTTLPVRWHGKPIIVDIFDNRSNRSAYSMGCVSVFLQR